MNNTWQTSFTVYPENCNYMLIDEKPMVHGGSMLLKMDRAAAECVRRFLYGTLCDSSRTVAVDDIRFVRGAKLGDLIVIRCEVRSVGIKRITVGVICWIDSKDGLELMADGEFNFVSFKNGEPHPHGIKKVK